MSCGPQLLRTLQTPLPVTFRLVVPSSVSAGNSDVAAKFERRMLAALASANGSSVPGSGAPLRAGADSDGDDRGGPGVAPRPLRRLQWYPQYSAAWQLECSRRGLRQAALRPLHELIVRAAEDGEIARQEAVSMLPPLFLQAEAGDLVLDLCAFVLLLFLFFGYVCMYVCVCVCVCVYIYIYVHIYVYMYIHVHM